jgi:hypothetical protein
MSTDLNLPETPCEGLYCPWMQILNASHVELPRDIANELRATILAHPRVDAETAAKRLRYIARAALSVHVPFAVAFVVSALEWAGRDATAMRAAALAYMNDPRAETIHDIRETMDVLSLSVADRLGSTIRGNDGPMFLLDDVLDEAEVIAACEARGDLAPGEVSMVLYLASSLPLTLDIGPEGMSREALEHMVDHGDECFYRAFLDDTIHAASADIR